MKKILRFCLAICLLLMAAIFGTRILGQTRGIPQSVAQLHLLDCVAPCWLGIVPGSTTIAEAKAKLLASFKWQNNIKMMDSGWASGPIIPTTIENIIQGDDFRFLVRLNISNLIDGTSEMVQSIGLLPSHGNLSNYTVTVADILGILGPPQGVVVDKMVSSRYEITLTYKGLDVIFYTYVGKVYFTENPTLYLGEQTTQIPVTGYRPWKGFSTLDLSR